MLATRRPDSISHSFFHISSIDIEDMQVQILIEKSLKLFEEICFVSQNYFYGATYDILITQ